MITRKNKKIGIIIQARTSSTRLPSKILKELPFESGITVLQQVIRRTNKVKGIAEVIVATTNSKKDGLIIRIAKKEKAKCFMGSEDNVLERYFLAAEKFKLDVIVRITSDCPCIDPEVINMVVKKHLNTNADYASNGLIKTFPIGMGVEVMSFAALKKAHKKATSKFDREHVCPYIYQTNPKEFKIVSIKASNKLFGPDIRVTLDTEDDYILLCAVFDYLYHQNKYFGLGQIISIFKAKPWLRLINRKSAQKEWLPSLNAEIKEALRILALNELENAKNILERHVKK